MAKQTFQLESEDWYKFRGTSIFSGPYELRGWEKEETGFVQTVGLGEFDPSLVFDKSKAEGSVGSGTSRFRFKRVILTRLRVRIPDNAPDTPLLQIDVRDNSSLRRDTEDLTDQWELNGGIRVTVANTTYAFAIDGADRRANYSWTPSNSADAIALYNALVSEVAGTVEFDDSFPRTGQDLIIGANSYGKIYIGSTEYSKAYLGDRLVFESGGT